MINAKMLYRHK